MQYLTNYNWADKKLLINDRDELTCLLYEEFFKPTEIKIYFASCCEEAYNICKTKKPDIVISEIRFPEICGKDYLKVLKAETSVPIIIITGSFFRKNENCDFNTPYLFLKPVSYDEIMDIMSSIFNKKV